MFRKRTLPVFYIKIYGLQLQVEGIDHNDIFFEDFLNSYNQELCPSHGVVTYEDGKVVCSIHKEKNAEEEEGDDGSIPYI